MHSPCSICNTKGEMAEPFAWHSDLLTLWWVERPPTPIPEPLLGTMKVAEGLGQLWTQDRKCQRSPTSFPPKRVKTMSGHYLYKAARVPSSYGVGGNDPERQKKVSPFWALSHGPETYLPLSPASLYGHQPCSIRKKVWPLWKPYPPQDGLSSPGRQQSLLICIQSKNASTHQVSLTWGGWSSSG